MGYTDYISRTEANPLIPVDVSRDIIQNAAESSAFLSAARRLQNMSSRQSRMKVLNLLPTAYFLDGDTSQKQTTKVSWDNVYLTAAELAVIVPIPEAVVDDAEYDIWGEIKPHIEAAFGKAIDGAAFFGTNKPTDWPTAILTAATAKSHVLDLSTQIAAGQDLYDILMGEDGLLALVEEDGYMVTNHIAALKMKAKLRGLREKVYNGTGLVAAGAPIFQKSMSERGGYDLDGEPLSFPKNGSMDAATALMFSGDFNQAVWSSRLDMSYKVLSEAVIQGPDGAILYNLAQQDMVALRCVMRLGWALPIPVNPVAADPYPFAVLVP